MTFFFLLIIIGCTSKNAAVGFAGIPIGLALTLIHLVSIPVTNTSVVRRAARASAVRRRRARVAALAVLIAPIVGAAIAGFVTRWLHEAADTV